MDINKNYFRVSSLFFVSPCLKFFSDSFGLDVGYFMKLSVIIPVYNEKNTIKTVLKRVLDVGINIDKEIIIVDDFSTDGTREILKEYETYPCVKVVYHPRNLGKGAGIKTGKTHITGDVVIIQDADLEYFPEDYPALIKPIVEDYADVVFGTRFVGMHRVFMFWHYLANKFLTFITNILYNTMLTDMEVGYKVFKKEIFDKIELKSKRFDFEPEITAKIFKMNCRVFEVPITYAGRGYEEGKKITWKDALYALVALVRFRFFE